MPTQELNAFLEDDLGAVTIDWVVLTAGVMGLVLLVAFPAIRASILTQSGNVGAVITSAENH